MRSVALSVAVLVGVALAGCAQQNDSPPASNGASPTSAAPTTPAAADAQALAKQIKAATADLPTVTVALRTQVSGVGTATVEFAGPIRMMPAAKAGMDLTMTTTEGGKTQTGRVVVLNRVFYVQEKGGELAPGKSWLRLSRDDLAALTDPAAAQLKATLQQVFDQLDQSLGSASPTDNLVLLEKGKLTGPPKTETTGGDTVSRYSGTTQFSALAGEEQYAQLGQLGVTQLAWTVSVDRDGLLRQFTLTVPLKTPKGTARTATTANYSKWGEPVSITAPPPDQVATISDLGH